MLSITSNKSTNHWLVSFNFYKKDKADSSWYKSLKNCENKMVKILFNLKS